MLYENACALFALDPLLTSIQYQLTNPGGLSHHLHAAGYGDDGASLCGTHRHTPLWSSS
ncbi:MAG: hypothetical protein ACLVJ6_05965 [Merdibacter sp.]